MVRYGQWFWYRSADGELREVVLPDINYSAVTDDEVTAVLLGERRDQ